ILVMGLTFKENCPDIRNSRVADVVEELRQYACRVDVHDPWADPAEAAREYGVTLVAEPERGAYDAIVVAVAHDMFRQMGVRRIGEFGRPHRLIYDVKYLFPAEETELRL